MFSNQHQIADVNDCREKKAKNERDLPDVDCINQHHHTAGDAEVPKLNGNNAAFKTFRDVPLDHEAAGEKQVGYQSEKRPESKLAGKIGPEIVQIMRQAPFHRIWPCPPQASAGTREIRALLNWTPARESFRN